MRTSELFVTGWEFCKAPLGTEYVGAKSWAAVDVPHDWLIYDTNDLYETSTGWYRNTLEVPEDGKRTFLRFEGVYMDCRVYVNGVLAGEWKYGYTSFGFDITELLHEGENLVAVRVDHHEPNSRWYSGAGIFRKVMVERYEPCHFLQDGIYISADAQGRVTVTAEVERPESIDCSKLTIKAEILKPAGDEYIVCAVKEYGCTAADRSVMEQSIIREGCSYSINEFRMSVHEPRLWDVEDPFLYLCNLSLYLDGELVDIEGCDFGFREFEFTPDQGFFINGRHLKLHGCCEHHDLGCLGSAVNVHAIRRKLKKLREMGINAVRTSHNPPAVELLELADETGMLILDEAFDMWELKKTDYDYARFFPEWVDKDVAAWVRRDRNHPCLIGWSIGNEIYDTHASARGQEVTSKLKHLVLRHDPRGNGVVTIGSNYMATENAQKCADILKVPGYNYAERLYEQHHAAHPDWCIYGSETSSVVQSRGIYHFPLEQPVLCDDDEQCSALGNSAPAWAANSYEACIIPDRDAPYCAGQFIWTGFDYIGEPTPYSTKNSYFGQIDTAGFYKDSAYVFRAAWTSYKDKPFVHIFPYWDFNEGEIIDIRVASNAPEIALFFNGEEISRERFDREHGDKITLDTKLGYQKGELTAIAYDEKGLEIARDSQCSFTDAVSLELAADKTQLNADGNDLIFIEISALDKKGNFVANANNRVFVEVTGAARLVGLDNGDSTDYEQYKGISRRLFSGRLLAVIAAKNQGGEITVKARSEGLKEAVLTLDAVGSGEGSCICQNTDTGFDCTKGAADIPVRKIELMSEDNRFDPDRREIKVAVKTLPENNTYGDEIEYRLTTVNGIDSNVARIKDQDSEGVTVECLGDGEFYLRALCKNGTEKYHIIGTKRFTAQGLGSAVTDPYEMVMGGLYSIRSGHATDGLQHGASFGVGGGYVGFENVDFGPLGSDRVTLPIFANCSTPVRVRIYDGIPDKGGELIDDLEYFVQPPIWLTYQAQSYKLSKKLKGIHTIVFQSDNAYDLQGFVFERPCKERAVIDALDRENIYGDKFTISQEAITGIGNNVTIDFGEFDLTQNKANRLCITGRSKLAVNSIHIIFGTEDGEKRALCEFEGCEDYVERSFELEGITGKARVQFTFLPGCDFDLKSFRFE